MNKYRGKYGITMLEVMVCVAVVITLVAVAIGVSTRMKTQGKQELAKSEIAILSTALEQYYDYTHQYPPDVNYAYDTGDGHPTRDFQKAMDVNVAPYAKPGKTDYGHYGNSTESPYDSIEVLYYYLNRVPASRNVLKKLPESALLAKAIKLSNNQPVRNTVYDPNLVIDLGVGGNQKLYGIVRIVDPWDTPLQYTHMRTPDQYGKYYETTNIPLIESAGPDRKFHTADDITSKDN